MILGILAMVIIVSLLGFAIWHDLYHMPMIKPLRKAICYKCRYCIKQRRFWDVSPKSLVEHQQIE